MIRNKRAEFILSVGEAVDAVKEEIVYAYQQRDELPDMAKCQQAADYINQHCRVKKFDVSASVYAIGRRVSFRIPSPKGVKGDAYDTFITLRKLGEDPEPIAINHVS